MIKIVEFSDNNIDTLLNFLINESESGEPAVKNMYEIDWETKPHTLPYKLLIEKQFSNGLFHLAFKDNILIGCSGCYISSFNDRLLLAGTRTWITHDYRNLQIPREYFLPIQKEYAISNNMGAIGLTFNEYNKNIINTFKRKRLGETRNQREPKHLFYNNMIEVEFPVNIQYTKQYVIYEQLDDTWQFNWDSIKFTD